MYFQNIKNPIVYAISIDPTTLYTNIYDFMEKKYENHCQMYIEKIYYSYYYIGCIVYYNIFGLDI